MSAITGYKYQCLRCGALGNSIRCIVCGGDTEPTDKSLIETESGGSYSIFDHAQGVKPGTRNQVSLEKL